MREFISYWRNRKSGCMAWLLTGAVIAWIVAALCVSPYGSLEDFYDFGEYEDYSPMLVNSLQNAQGMTMSGADLLIAEQEALKIFTHKDDKTPWSYLSIELSHMNTDSLVTTVICTDIGSVVVFEKEVTLRSGKNIVFLGKTPFTFLQFQWKDQAGATFNIRNMRVSVEEDSFPVRTFFLICVVVMFLYVFATWLFLNYASAKQIFGRHVFFNILYGLQQIWMIVSLKILQKRRIHSEKWKSAIRTGCFLGIDLIILIVTKFFRYNNPMTYRVEILLVCVLLFIASAMNLNGHMKIFAYKSPLVLSWTALCVMMCVSDFVVQKRRMYTGYWLLLVWLFFFWTWNNMERPGQILKEWLWAFEVTFWVSAAFCLFCTVNSGPSYVGIMKNPNPFGQFMGIGFIVFLGLMAEGGRQSFLRLLVLAVGLDISVYYMILSQCRTGILAAAAGAVLFLRWMKQAKRRGKFVPRCLVGIVMSLLLLYPVFLGSEYIMAHNSVFSRYFKSMETVNIEEDGQLADCGEVVCAAQASIKTGKIARSLQVIRNLDQFSSGRISVYKKYINEMNLFGHFNYEDVFGIDMGAHNTVLMIGYRYGIFAMIPCVILWLYALWYSLKYKIRTAGESGRYGFCMNGLLVAALICGLLDQVENPMNCMPWYVMYFVVGFFFNWSDANDADKKIV